MAWTHPLTLYWEAGMVITVANMNTYVRDNMKDLYTICAYQTETLTKNASTTFSNLVGLTWAVTSGETWCWRATIYVDTLAAADAKFTVTAPAASTGRFGITGAGAPLTNGFETTFGNPIAYAAGGGKDTMFMGGYVSAGADGSMQIQAAQNTANVSDTVFAANAYLVAYRITA